MNYLKHLGLTNIYIMSVKFQLVLPEKRKKKTISIYLCIKQSDRGNLSNHLSMS